ncbi:unnamed protein product [Diatraea saccharalis]|uniref:Uncharacterized protein n=1 Tax=Diatraea saccharalis TaxID=40085 RepID=A0A9N9R1N8_9NEOP|nr:unnamed protein product [Diatraea saccharalis]
MISGGSGWGAATRARSVYARAAPLVPADAALRLVAANTCYGMGWIEEGIESAESALSIEEQKEGELLARCCLYAGIGHQMKAQVHDNNIYSTLLLALL